MFQEKNRRQIVMYIEMTSSRKSCYTYSQKDLPNKKVTHESRSQLHRNLLYTGWAKK